MEITIEIGAAEDLRGCEERPRDIKVLDLIAGI